MQQDRGDFTMGGRAVGEDHPDATGSESPSVAVMYITNRKGKKEAVSFDKILKRISDLATGLHPLVNPPKVAQAVINGMFTGIKTTELDELAAQTCAYMAATHPDFSKLAARISVSNLQKNTSDDFAFVMQELHDYVDAMGRDAKMIADEVHEFVQANKEVLNREIDYRRDLEFDYFGFKTLEKSYLLRKCGKVLERPQHLFMRVACGIHCGNIDNALETYHLMSQKFFTHATPTLFNAGTCNPQMSSCFLLQMQEDSIEGIFETLKKCALISKSAGGIGLAVHKIRASGSYIRGTNGYSNGLTPLLRVFNDAARYVDQGGGKRKGSFAIYLEPWHADIFSWLDLKKNHGKEEDRARDLFYGLWVPDLFMERVSKDMDWTLMCPNDCPGLAEHHGAEFEALYIKYEKMGRGSKVVKAQQLWFAILQSQVETGTPYLVYKDGCNNKSNQQNLGTIQCSNLCTEIVEYTSKDEIAVCNLASIALPKFVDRKRNKFDFDLLRKVTTVVTKNLNLVIDRNMYPLEECRASNMRHRPIGLGVQGFADTLMLLGLAFESPEALELNRGIFETIYFAACETSCALAAVEGPYSTFKGSPASQGRLQFDLWNEDYDRKGVAMRVAMTGMWDWETLKERIKKVGMRNSLLVAPMPTASTSQILGNCESFEPYTSNIYQRRVLSGEFFVVNPHLLRNLISLGLWNEKVKQQLIANNGSVQFIPGIPDNIKKVYKTVWEIKQKAIMDLAIARGPFVDQSQSLNLHVVAPTFAKLSSMHFYGWKAGLKTGMYYLRTQAAVDAIKFTVDKATIAAVKQAKDDVSPHVVSHKHATSTQLPEPAKHKAKTDQVTAALATTTSGSAENDENNNIQNHSSFNGPNQMRSAVYCPMRKPGMAEEDFCFSCSG